MIRERRRRAREFVRSATRGYLLAIPVLELRFISRQLLLLVVLLAGCVTKVHPLPDYVIKTSAPPFKPPEPSKKNWDWVQLTSDEWLKGEIKYLRNYTLEIDSDELDDLKFAWRKVKVVKSPRYMSMLLENQSTISGPVMIKDNQVVVKSGERFAVFPRNKLMTIVPGGKSEKSYWSGKLSLGATVRSGNTDQVDTNLGFDIRRRAPRSRFSADYMGAFGSLNGVETVNNQRFTTRFDLYIAPRWFVTPVALELYADAFQNIELRTTPLAGAGYYILKKGLDRQSVCDWDITGLAGYRVTRFQSGEEPSSTATVGFITNVDWDLTEKLELKFDYDIQVGVPNTQDTNFNLTFTLEWDAWKDFELQMSFVWNYIGLPRPDDNGDTPLNSDFRMVFGIAWDF